MDNDFKQWRFLGCIQNTIKGKIASKGSLRLWGLSKKLVSPYNAETMPQFRQHTQRNKTLVPVMCNSL